MELTRPTTRFVIEPSLVCNAKCRACYHLHRYEQWPQTVKTLDAVKGEIDAGVARGNDHMDITGGEPTLYPHITEVVGYAREKGVKPSIITNGMVVAERADEIMDAGLSDWLVSHHGTTATHDIFTNRNGAHRRQMRFLEHVSGRVPVRFNCVLTSLNERELPAIAREMAAFGPKVVNFINFNPHHEWRDRDADVAPLVADLDAVEGGLDEAIAYLRGLSVTVRVRYYPMCRLAAEHRDSVVNDLAVTFDEYEWDYGITPKTVDAHRAWGVATSAANEEKGEPCCRCSLHAVCGGANRHWHRVSTDRHGEQLIPALD